MPSERELFVPTHRRQIILARFDHDAARRAQRSRPAYMHQPDAILHSCAEQGAAPANLDTCAVELDRHHVRVGGHLLEARGERLPEFAIVNSARGFDSGLHPHGKIFFSCFSIHYSSFRLLRRLLRARASRDSTACSLSRNIRAISGTPISSTYLRINTSRYSGRSAARARLNSGSAATPCGVASLVTGAARMRRARRALVRMSERTLRCAIAHANVNSELSPRKNGSASASAINVSCKMSSASSVPAPSELAMNRRMRAA